MGVLELFIYFNINEYRCAKNLKGAERSGIKGFIVG